MRDNDTALAQCLFGPGEARRWEGGQTLRRSLETSGAHQNERPVTTPPNRHITSFGCSLLRTIGAHHSRSTPRPRLLAPIPAFGLQRLDAGPFFSGSDTCIARISSASLTAPSTRTIPFEQSALAHATPEWETRAVTPVGAYERRRAHPEYEMQERTLPYMQSHRGPPSEDQAIIQPGLSAHPRALRAR